MILATCTTPTRRFWGVFETSAEAIRLVFEGVSVAYPDEPPSSMSLQLTPVSCAVTSVGVLYEEANA